MNDLYKFIAIPLTINNLNQDKEHLKKFKMAPAYIKKLNATIKLLQQDFYNLKGKYHKVRKVDNYTYIFKGNEYKFTSEELKDMTRKVMEEYLSKPVKLEGDDMSWDDRYN